MGGSRVKGEMFLQICLIYPPISYGWRLRSEDEPRYKVSLSEAYIPMTACVGMQLVEQTF